MIVGDAERHELLEAQFFRDIKIEELRAGRRELEALTDNLRPHEKSRRNFVDAQACSLKILERPELIERMQGFAHRIFSERIFFLDPFRLHDTGNGRVLGEALLLDEQLQRREPSASGAHREFSVFRAFVVRHGPNAQRLQQSPTGNILRQFFDAYSRLDPAHIPAIKNLLAAVLKERLLPFEVRVNTSETKGKARDMPDFVLGDDKMFVGVYGEVKRADVALEDLAGSTEQNDQIGRYLAQTGVVLLSNVRGFGLLACVPGYERPKCGAVPPEKRDLIKTVDLWAPLPERDRAPRSTAPPWPTCWKLSGAPSPTMRRLPTRPIWRRCWRDRCRFTLQSWTYMLLDFNNLSETEVSLKAF